MKLDSPKPEAAPETTEPAPAKADAGFGADMPEAQPASDDKPFDAEPFEAGVEADEESDPKKFIEQLTGKLGQSLRKYNEDQGQPDFELEKFAINSLLSASHTSEMDSNDQDDIIKKVKEAGHDNQEDNQNDNSDNSTDNNDDSSNGDSSGNDFSGDMGSDDQGGAENGGEVNEEESLFLKNPKKNNMFQPGSNDILDNNLKESKKCSIFAKSKIKSKLQETFNQEDEMSEPMVEPAVKPAPVKTPKKQPSIAPSRKNKPFLPMPEVQPDPKATN